MNGNPNEETPTPKPRRKRKSKPPEDAPPARPDTLSEQLEADKAKERDRLAAATGAGSDVLSVIVEELKKIGVPFSVLTEEQQNATIERLGQAVRGAIRRGFEAIIVAGFPHANATLEKVAFTSKGVQGTLSLEASSEYRHALSDHAGRGVVVVLASPDAYVQGMEAIRGDPDQARLLIDFDDDDSPPDDELPPVG
jgi:uridine phosphorylase